MQKCQGLTEAMVQLHLPQRIGFQELRPCAVWIFPSSKKDACCVSFCPSSGELIAAGINFESGCKLEGSTVRKTEACVGRSRWYFLQWDASSVCRQRAEWSPPPIQSVLLQIHPGRTVAPLGTSALQSKLPRSKCCLQLPLTLAWNSKVPSRAKDFLYLLTSCFPLQQAAPLPTLLPQHFF